MGVSGGSGSSSFNQQSTFSPPPWAAAGGQQAVQTAQSLAQMPFAIPQQPIAPLTGQQAEAFQSVENLQGAYTPFVNAGMELNAQGANPNIGQYFNTESAGVLPELEDVFAQQQAQTTGSSVQQAGGVDASRIGVAQSELANQQGLSAGQTLSQIMGQSVSQAQAGAGLEQSAGANIANEAATGQTMGLQAANAELSAGTLQQQQLQNEMNAQYQNQLQDISWPFQTNQYLSAIVSGITPSMGGMGVTQGNSQSSNKGASGSLGGGLGAIGGLMGKGSGGRVADIDEILNAIYGEGDGYAAGGVTPMTPPMQKRIAGPMPQPWRPMGQTMPPGGMPRQINTPFTRGGRLFAHGGDVGGFKGGGAAPMSRGGQPMQGGGIPPIPPGEGPPNWAAPGTSTFDYTQNIGGDIPAGPAGIPKASTENPGLGNAGQFSSPWAGLVGTPIGGGQVPGSQGFYQGLGLPVGYNAAPEWLYGISRTQSGLPPPAAAPNLNTNWPTDPSYAAGVGAPTLRGSPGFGMEMLPNAGAALGATGQSGGSPSTPYADLLSGLFNERQALTSSLTPSGRGTAGITSQGSGAANLSPIAGASGPGHQSIAAHTGFGHGPGAATGAGRRRGGRTRMQSGGDPQQGASPDLVTPLLGGTIFDMPGAPGQPPPAQTGVVPNLPVQGHQSPVQGWATQYRGPSGGGSGGGGGSPGGGGQGGQGGQQQPTLSGNQGTQAAPASPTAQPSGGLGGGGLGSAPIPGGPTSIPAPGTGANPFSTRFGDWSSGPQGTSPQSAPAQTTLSASSGNSPPGQTVKGSWFGSYSGQHSWSDPSAGTHTASGTSLNTPGIALPTKSTLGQMFTVTGPNGNSITVPQTDVGPANWTGRGVDLTGSAAEMMGYTPHNFPTDGQFHVAPAQLPAAPHGGTSTIPGAPHSSIAPPGGGMGGMAGGAPMGGGMPAMAMAGAGGGGFGGGMGKGAEAARGGRMAYQEGGDTPSTDTEQGAGAPTISTPVSPGGGFDLGSTALPSSPTGELTNMFQYGIASNLYNQPGQQSPFSSSPDMQSTQTAQQQAAAQQQPPQAPQPTPFSPPQAPQVPGQAPVSPSVSRETPFDQRFGQWPNQPVTDQLMYPARVVGQAAQNLVPAITPEGNQIYVPREGNKQQSPENAAERNAIDNTKQLAGLDQIGAGSPATQQWPTWGSPQGGRGLGQIPPWISMLGRQQPSFNERFGNLPPAQPYDRAAALRNNPGSAPAPQPGAQQPPARPTQQAQATPPASPGVQAARNWLGQMQGKTFADMVRANPGMLPFGMSPDMVLRLMPSNIANQPFDLGSTLGMMSQYGLDPNETIQKVSNGKFDLKDLQQASVPQQTPQAQPQTVPGQQPGQQPGSLPQQQMSFFTDRAQKGGQWPVNPNVQPQFANGLYNAVQQAEAATGSKATFTSMMRADPREQQQYYAAYRNGSGGLAAPPGTSLHERGLATDLADGPVLNWLHQHPEVMAQNGISFLPGRAGAVDPGHVQMANARGQPEVAQGTAPQQVAQAAPRPFYSQPGSQGSYAPPPGYEDRARKLAAADFFYTLGGYPPGTAERVEGERFGLYNAASNWASTRNLAYGDVTPQEGASGLLNEANASQKMITATGDAAQAAGIKPSSAPGGGASGAGAQGRPQQQSNLAGQSASERAGQLTNQSPEVAMVGNAMRFMQPGTMPQYRQQGIETMNQVLNGIAGRQLTAAQTQQVMTTTARAGWMPFGPGMLNVDPNFMGGIPQNDQRRFVSPLGMLQMMANTIDQQSPRTTPVAQPQPVTAGAPSLGGAPGQAPPAPQQTIPGMIPAMTAPQAPSPISQTPIPAGPVGQTMGQTYRPSSLNATDPFVSQTSLTSQPPQAEMPQRFSALNPSSPYFDQRYAVMPLDQATREVAAGNDKFLAEATERAKAADNIDQTLEAMERAASQLRKSEFGPLTPQKTEAATAINQGFNTLGRILGIEKMPQISTNPSIDEIESLQNTLSRDYASSFGATGRGAGMVLRYMRAGQPGTEMSGIDAIMGTIGAMRAENARTKDYANDLSQWTANGLPATMFDRWFDQAHPIGNYVTMGELYGARNETGSKLTNGHVALARDWAEKHPGYNGQDLQQRFHLSTEAMQTVMGR